MPLPLPLLLLLSGCGVTGWQDPPRGEAGARSNTRLDARPRPGCRPAAATPSR